MSLSSLPEACSTCIRFLGNQQGPTVENEGVSSIPKLICDAFPSGIPEDIVTGRNDHTSPVDGDNGLMYIEMPDAE
jgi:hypothetical protein